ncbi:TonB-dependent receptor plug domain-containing protein [Roseateles sp. BYS180W]|uniref:TonB-dependent receptor plug domain-containing protein n=1 Tax=Roseateles rivi TaxID=3299028 RepID=A0ABW7FWR2_9BURK
MAVLISANALAESPPQQPAVLPAAEVKGQTSDTTLRKLSTAAKQVVGREEIERMGGANAKELLKQLPGVETDVYGAIALRGLAGYTQILVDGKPPAPGLQPLDLAPAQIERIEVIRGATADLPGQGVGGTINLVLRAVKPTRYMTELQGTVSRSEGPLDPGVNLVRHGQWSADAAYTATASLGRFAWQGQTHTVNTRDGLAPVDQTSTTQGTSEDASARLKTVLKSVAGGELQWEGGLSTYLTRGEQAQQLASADPLPFDHAQRQWRRLGHMADTQAQWTHPWGETGSLSVELGLQRATARSRAQGVQTGAVPNDTQSTQSERNWSRSGGLKWSDEFASAHQLSAGWNWQKYTNADQTERWRNGLPDTQLANWGDGSDGRSVEASAFVQDDWTVSPRLSLTLGWRWEQRRFSEAQGLMATSSRFSVPLPSINALYKLDDADQDQLRLGLSRTYKAPGREYPLLARPTVNPFFACPQGGRCGANDRLHPDTLGNPALQPETAWGLDAAWEHSLPKDGMVSVGVFHRRINNRIATALQQQPVDWANVPRWVTLPVNHGSAWSQGLELEAKLRLDMLSEALPAWMARASLSRYRSRDSALPAPYNLLAGQGRGSAKLGFSQQLQSLPLDWSVDARWRDGGLMRLNAYELQDTATHWTVDASLGWRFSPQTQLSLRGSNLNTPTQRSRLGSTDPTGGPTLWQQRADASRQLWQLTLDTKF